MRERKRVYVGKEEKVGRKRECVNEKVCIRERGGGRIYRQERVCVSEREYVIGR